MPVPMTAQCPLRKYSRSYEGSSYHLGYFFLIGVLGSKLLEGEGCLGFRVIFWGVKCLNSLKWVT